MEKDYWQDFARSALSLGSPLYAQLSLAIDSDAELKALAARRRKGQPPANLLFAAVHYLLLQGAEHPLRAFYPTLGGKRTGAQVFPLFRDFVASHRAQIGCLVETRVTNTNEVGRASVLRAGFGALAQAATAPLHLIEIGPSAGLNLIWDRYGVSYVRDGVPVEQVVPEAPLILSCELKSDAVPPVRRMPDLAGRVGLELNPVDLAKAEERDWLRAMIWADQPRRLARLETAIAMFREAPVPIRPGDALDLLPQALAEIPSDDAVCVYHSVALYQFSTAMRQALQALLAIAAPRRPLWHLSFEFDGGSDYVVSLTHHRGGVARSRRLALAQSHGGWIAWTGG